jgi:RNA polymerase sigma-70 factor (sigma-E family)
VPADSDHAAYVEFVTVRWAALYRTAYLLTGNHSEADDLLQSALVKTFIAWGRVAKVGEPDAYVRRIMANALISSRRRGVWRRERVQHKAPDLPSPSHEPASVDRLNLWDHIKVLPPRQRAVIVLRFYEDMSERQIAETLGCSAGTVKSQASDALRTLRSRLGAEPEAEGLHR